MAFPGRMRLDQLGLWLDIKFLVGQFRNHHRGLPGKGNGREFIFTHITVAPVLGIIQWVALQVPGMVVLRMMMVMPFTGMPMWSRSVVVHHVPGLQEDGHDKNPCQP
jgi:hypothetical protein